MAGKPTEAGRPSSISKFHNNNNNININNNNSNNNTITIIIITIIADSL